MVKSSFSERVFGPSLEFSEFRRMSPLSLFWLTFITWYWLFSCTMQISPVRRMESFMTNITSSSKKTRLKWIANNFRLNIIYRNRHWVIKTVDWDLWEFKPLCIDSSINTDSFGWSFILFNYLFSMVIFFDFFRDMLII